MPAESFLALRKRCLLQRGDGVAVPITGKTGSYLAGVLLVSLQCIVEETEKDLFAMLSGR